MLWTDPDINESELAFYYVHVLEIPTPRCKFGYAKCFALKSILEEVPMITLEWTYASPTSARYPFSYFRAVNVVSESLLLR